MIDTVDGCANKVHSDVNNVNTYKIYSADSSYDVYKSQKLGHGSYSSVCLGKCTSGKIEGQLVAIKRITKSILSNRGLSMLSSEIGILKEIIKFSHPNIVTCYDIIDDIDVVYIIMEYCNDGDFSKMLIKKPMKYKFIKFYFNQIVDGIKYLHDRGIIHRDIKPKNILMTNNKKTIKICDFGFAKRNDKVKRVYTVCGSPLYMAPDIYQKIGYNEVVDVWSLGMILYEMIFGKHPLASCDDPQKLIQSITTTDIHIPTSCPEIEEDCINLLQQMLRRREYDRITMEQIFEHKWLEECKKINIDDEYDFSTIHNLPTDECSQSAVSSVDVDVLSSSNEKELSCIFMMDTDDIETV